jgi:hypothetical protein
METIGSHKIIDTIIDCSDPENLVFAMQIIIDSGALDKLNYNEISEVEHTLIRKIVFLDSKYSHISATISRDIRVQFDEYQRVDPYSKIRYILARLEYLFKTM